MPAQFSTGRVGSARWSAITGTSFCWDWRIIVPASSNRLQHIEEACRIGDWYLFWPALAMTYHRLGQADDARVWLNKAEEMFRDVTESGSERLKTLEEDPFLARLGVFRSHVPGSSDTDRRREEVGRTFESDAKPKDFRRNPGRFCSATSH